MSILNLQTLKPRDKNNGTLRASCSSSWVDCCIEQN